MTRVLLWGGAPTLAHGLRTAFAEAGDFVLITSSGGADLGDLAVDRPDVILLDASAEMARDILSLLQHLTPLPQIVLRLPLAAPELALSMVPQGVRGVILASAPMEALLRCLTSVLRARTLV